MHGKLSQKMAIFIFLMVNFLNFCFASSLSYSPQILQEKDLPNNLGIFKQLKFISPDQSIITIDTVKLSHPYHAKIYEQKKNSQFFAYYMQQLFHHENFTIAINGGFYSKNFQPIGLFIKEGIVLNPWANSSLLAACVIVNKLGKLSIGIHKKTCINAFSAIQTGPLLIEKGDLRSKLYVPKKRSDFFAENYRTVVAISDKDEICLLVSSRAKLIDIAHILKNNPEAFGIKHFQSAINLDGGSSTGMYIAFSPSPFYIHEQKPVRTFIMIN